MSVFLRKRWDWVGKDRCGGEGVCFSGDVPPPGRREINMGGIRRARAFPSAQRARGARTMAAMHSLLMLLLGLFCAQAEVPVQPDFDLEKFSGTWHIMAAVSDCPVFQSMRDSMTTSAAIVKPLPNGDVHLTVGYPVAGECKKVDMLLKKTDQPGRFTNEENGRKDIRVVATDYKTHGFLYYYKEMPGEPTSITLQLFTRTPEATPEMMEKFKEHYHTLGLTDDLMVALPASDVCAKMLSH